MKHQDVKPRSGAGAVTPTFAPSSLCSRAVWQVLGPHKNGTCSLVLRGTALTPALGTGSGPRSV